MTTIKRLTLKKVGGSWGFVIPKGFIDHGDLIEGNQYELIIRDELFGIQSRDRQSIEINSPAFSRFLGGDAVPKFSEVFA